MIKYLFLKYKRFEQETNLNFSFILIFIVIILLVGYFFNIEYIKILVAKAGFWGPMVIIIAKILTIVVAPLSGAPLYLLAGVFFGFPLGLVYVAIGDFIGYTTSFYIARVFGRQVVNRFISLNEQALFTRIVVHLGTFKGYIQSCFIFFPLPELLSYGVGLTSLAYWKFIIVLFPGSCLITGLIVLTGDYFGQSDSSLILMGLLPFMGFIMVIAGIWFFSKNIRKI